MIGLLYYHVIIIECVFSIQNKIISFLPIMEKSYKFPNYLLFQILKILTLQFYNRKLNDKIL